MNYANYKSLINNFKEYPYKQFSECINKAML